MGSPRARTYFAPVSGWEHPALIALGSLLPAMLAVAVTAGSGLLSPGGGGIPLYSLTTVVFLTVLVQLILIPPFFAGRKNYKLPTLYAGTPVNGESKLWHRSAAATAAIGFVAFVFMETGLIQGLNRANSIPAYWRSVNLLSGVSPLLPQVLLIAGAYLWFWCSLRGLAHFGEDRPLLPKKEHLPELDKNTPAMPMFSRNQAGDLVEDAARPLTWSYLWTLAALFPVTILVCAVALKGFWVRTLGERKLGWVIFFWVCLYIAVILADALQLWRAWSELRQLLVHLDRLPLRRTLSALKGLAWGSIWKMSGNVLEERYRVVSFQLESLSHLRNTIDAWVPDNPSAPQSKDEVLAKVAACQEKSRDFARWYVALPKDQPVENLTKLRDFQEELASLTGLVMKNVLIPAWQTEKHSLIFTRSSLKGKGDEGGETEVVIPTEKLAPHVRAAEEFFVLPYLAFIQNIFGRIRTIVLGILWLFVGTTLAISSYPFDPLNVLGGIFLAVFVFIFGLTVLVYSQMSRDATLSHITNTNPGELGWDFWVRLVGFGIGPLIGLLTTLFPSISDFVFSWLQPSVQAFK
jgi:hypothetical protein